MGISLRYPLPSSTINNYCFAPPYACALRTLTQKSLQNYYKFFKYANILSKKLKMLAFFYYFVQNSCCLHESANVISRWDCLQCRCPRSYYKYLFQSKILNHKSARIAMIRSAVWPSHNSGMAPFFHSPAKSLSNAGLIAAGFVPLSSFALRLLNRLNNRCHLHKIRPRPCNQCYMHSFKLFFCF